MGALVIWIVLLVLCTAALLYIAGEAVEHRFTGRGGSDPDD